MWADSVTPQSITRQWELLSGTSPEVVVPFSTPRSYIPLIKATDSTALLSQNYSSKKSKPKQQHYSLLIVLPEWSEPHLKGTSPSEEGGNQQRPTEKKGMEKHLRRASLQAICLCNKRCWQFSSAANAKWLASVKSSVLKPWKPSDLLPVVQAALCAKGCNIIHTVWSVFFHPRGSQLSSWAMLIKGKRTFKPSVFSLVQKTKQKKQVISSTCLWWPLRRCCWGLQFLHTCSVRRASESRGGRPVFFNHCAAAL